MLGSIIGDIVGSVYEFRNYRAKDFDPLFHPEARFTDDTVCTVAVADALARGADAQQTLQLWCRRYAENGGWGRKFSFWIFEDDPKPYGSWGNGAAMRIGPAGLLARTQDEALAWSDAISRITHDHSEAMTAARAVAMTVFWARRKVPTQDIFERLKAHFGYDTTPTPDQIRPGYERTERARDSVPQAISCALHGESFEDALRNAVSIGGDSDTIAAIAGAIAEARFGLPDEIAARAWGYLPEDMKDALQRFYAQL
jgi:ADP-ribosyl-[dinitrogen reductase] hydrolase